MSHLNLAHTQPTQYANKLHHHGVIQLSGEEKISYLQGQVTADINQLTDSNTLLGCHCDFKGKIWSVFYVVNWLDSLLLITHNSVLSKSLAELNKYGVFAKVEITDQSDDWTIIGGSGSLFESAVIECFGELPNEDRHVIQNNEGLVISFVQPHQRYLVLQPSTAEKILACDLSESEEEWEISDIKAGLGEIRDATINEFVPQMLNLHALQAIDFEKGCYMGQEVIARTKYLGRNKRAGFILKTDSSQINLTGEQLEYQIGENWRPGGKILRSGTNHEGTWIFAVLANDTKIGTSFRLKSAAKTIFVVQALPYPL